jgi:hypothetical protein
MIAEVIPARYDVDGRRVSQPFLHRSGPHPTFPMGRYVSQPLTVRCTTLEEVRQFLRTCKCGSDLECFGKREYWQPPEEFERSRKGDCDEFALWTWRQLLSMGYDARFVGGKAGRYSEGHAWVQYAENGRWYLVEPTLRQIGLTLPRLSTLKYEPKLSVAWDGKALLYYAHREQGGPFPWKELFPMLWEWGAIWGWFWLRVLAKVYRVPFIFSKNWLQ